MRHDITRLRCTSFTLALVATLFWASVVGAQTTSFTYQGRLTDSGTPANANYDLQFTVWDALSGGTQQPQLSPVTVARSGVAVANGIFTVQLDFGANAFPGANRFLEISARLTGAGSFTTLAPRQPITSTPYAVRSASAGNADTATNATNATTATNATQLGGVAASQYVQTNDSRLTDSRPPTPGSANYVQNTTTQQTSANFNISGNGTIGTNLTVGGALNANGSGLTNLNAGNITTGTLNNARLGQIPTANIADSAVTAQKIAPSQVVKGVSVGATTLTDNITLAAGSNITLTPAGNTVTIASTGGGGGVSGSGTTSTIPVWSGGTTLGNSVITQSANGVQLPNGVQLGPGN